MRGIRQLWTAIAAVSALCALAIVIAPVIGPLDKSVRVADIDPRWDGEWEHRRPPRAEIEFLGNRADAARIGNRWLPEDIGQHDLTLATGIENAVPQDPFLRIETEQHSATLRSIDVDPQGRYLVAGAWDKTARVWAIPQSPGEKFRLLSILRPPIGDENEGKIYAVAISPDSEIVAAAGWTGYDWDGFNCIYIFDRASGRMMKRIVGLPEVIDGMAFSPDGGALVAGLGGRYGVRAFRTADWSPVAIEGQEDYGSNVYALSFAPDGRLATGSYDGYLRVYTPDFKLLNMRRVLDGDEITEISFSRDNRIAAASRRQPKIAVVSGDDLSELYRPAVSDLPRYTTSALSSVAWSADGKILYAGGRAARFFDPKFDERFIRIYADGGRGSYRDIPVSEDTVQQIRATPKGLAFGASDPVIGLMSPDGAIVDRARSVMTDIRVTPYQRRNRELELRVSRDGYSVSLPFNFLGENFWRFDSRRRKTTVSPDEATDLGAPRMEAPGLLVSNWMGSSAPSLNGARLPLKAYESSHSLAVAPDGDRFLLGSDWNLALYDASGERIWNTASPAGAWQVNISGDGRLAVAGYGDGTVRWYRMDDGEELLAYFITNEPDNPRWVAWTPAGYYDASPGAEDLIGWHVNQDADKESLFFSASRFRDLYYRPDVIRNVLRTRKVAPAPSREKLLKAAPPVITILGERTLPNGDIVVDYEARTIYGDPADIDIEVFVDDSRLDLSGARYAVAPAQRQSLTIPRGSCGDVAMVAAVEGKRSAPASRPRASRLPQACTGEAPKPNLYALIIGVGDYANKKLTLDFADEDARDFAAMLELQKGAVFNDVDIKVITNEGATKTNIQTALEALLDNESVTKYDVTVLFFAGHGVKLIRESGGDRTADLYLASHEADMRRLAQTAVNATRLIEAVTGRVGRKFVFLDACFSNFGEASGLGLFDMQGIANTLGGSDIRAEVFSSSTGDQVSYEDDAWKNGAFTEAILEGLSGKADFIPDHRITNGELNLYLTQRVSELTNRRQTPTYTAAGSVEFNLAHVLEQ